MSTTHKSQSNFLFGLALVFAVWFLLTSWIWGYLACLVVSYPIGIAGAVIWYKNRNKPDETKRYTYIGWILLLGLAISLVALVTLLLNN